MPLLANGAKGTWQGRACEPARLVAGPGIAAGTQKAPRGNGMPDRAAEPDPRDASAYEAEGKSLQKLNRHREAIACADKALRLNPGSASAHRIKGKSLQIFGEHREAMACFDVAAGLNPDYSFAHATKGQSLQELGKTPGGDSVLLMSR